jgi:hypothetical protein
MREKPTAFDDDEDEDEEVDFDILFDIQKGARIL